ncbi:hypothetical protein N0824_01297 [Microcystis sp. 0824]|nr:hypothetical protein N0824_01297 [Microcystis sp. 0824]
MNQPYYESTLGGKGIKDKIYLLFNQNHLIIGTKKGLYIFRHGFPL